MRFLQLPLKCALLLASFVLFALCLDYTVVKLGVALLAVSQLHIELFKPALGHGFAFFQVAQLRFNVNYVDLNLLGARAGLLGQLRQAQHFNLQRVGGHLRVCGGAARGHQPLGGIGIAGLRPNGCRPRFFADQHLRFELLVEVFNFLRTSQQTSLL